MAVKELLIINKTMKQITELSEQEILALTNEQLDQMVKYKMAESGIKILDRPEEPVYNPMPEKTAIAYKVKGVDNYFEQYDDAKLVADAITDTIMGTATTRYPTINYNLSYLEPYSKEEYSFRGIGTIEKCSFYTKKEVEALKDIEEGNKQLKADYEAALREFNEAKEASADIVDMVYGTWRKVFYKYEKMATMQYEYQKYLRLAGDDKEIAMRFLKSAYSIDEQTEAYVQGLEWNPPTEEPTPQIDQQ